MHTKNVQFHIVHCVLYTLGLPLHTGRDRYIESASKRVTRYPFDAPGWPRNVAGISLRGCFKKRFLRLIVVVVVVDIVVGSVGMKKTKNI